MAVQAPPTAIEISNTWCCLTRWSCSRVCTIAGAVRATRRGIWTVGGAGRARARLHAREELEADAEAGRRLALEEGLHRVADVAPLRSRRRRLVHRQRGVHQHVEIQRHRLGGGHRRRADAVDLRCRRQRVQASKPRPPPVPALPLLVPPPPVVPPPLLPAAPGPGRRCRSSSGSRRRCSRAAAQSRPGKRSSDVLVIIGLLEDDGAARELEIDRLAVRIAPGRARRAAEHQLRGRAGQHVPAVGGAELTSTPWIFTCA